MKVVKVVVLLLSVVLLVAFLFENRDAFLYATTFEFSLFGPLQFSIKPIPLYGLILGSIFGGGVVAALYLGLDTFRSRRTLRSVKRQNKSLQEELKSLRNLPITEAEMPVSQPAETPGSQSAEETEKADSE